MTFAHRARRFALVAGAIAVLAIAAGPVLAAEQAVSIVDKKFEPAEITIAPGDTVTWTVTKAIGEPHSVTAGTPNQPKTDLFDSGVAGLKDEGATFSFTFDEAGTYEYFCSIHSGEMTGKVIVGEGGEGGGEAVEEDHPPVAPERKVLGAGILAATLVVLFGAAWVWRRMNPA
jgi:plastocyanin